MSAGRMQPRHADPVSFLYRGHAGTHRGDGADALMPRDEGWARLYRPVAVHRMQVGVADPPCLDLDQDLAWTNLRHRNLVDRRAAALNWRTTAAFIVFAIASSLVRQLN